MDDARQQFGPYITDETRALVDSVEGGALEGGLLRRAKMFAHVECFLAMWGYSELHELSISHREQVCCSLSELAATGTTAASVDAAFSSLVRREVRQLPARDLRPCHAHRSRPPLAPPEEPTFDPRAEDTAVQFRERLRLEDDEQVCMSLKEPPAAAEQTRRGNVPPYGSAVCECECLDADEADE